MAEIVCPTCGEPDWERAGDDVARCRNCGYLWILPPDPPARGSAAD
jgi:ribosomal protein L37AE/L43A